MMFKKIYIYWINFSIMELLSLENYSSHINSHKVIFSQCGGLSLSIYLSRPDEIYYGR